MLQNLKQHSKTRAVSKATPPPRIINLTPVLANTREEVRLRRERCRKIQSFIRSLVDEHIALRAMGVSDTASLFRMSAACSKIDVVEAQLRAGSCRSACSSGRPAVTCRG